MKEKLILTLEESSRQLFFEIGFQKVSVLKGLENLPIFEIIATTGITGDITGMIMIKSGIKDIINVSNKMLMKIGYTGDKDIFGDSQKEAFYEFSNMLVGKTLNNLSIEGFDCNLTPPTIITGNKINPAVFHINYFVQTGLKGSFGKLMLYFYVKKG